MAEFTFDAFPAYRGTQPFAFVSYAHEDSARVAPLLTRLYQAGINLWYDEGITPGAKWRDELAVAIEESAAVLFLLTEGSAHSQYCRSEVDFALDSRTPILTLQFEELEVPPGLRLGLADRQIVPVHTMSVDEAMEKTLDWLHDVTPGGNRASEVGAELFAIDLPQSVLRRYALDRALSASRMVFRARGIQRKRWVTVQRLIAGNAARAAGYLRFCRDNPHRNLVHVLELQSGTEDPYVVSDYIEGTSLRTLIANSETAGLTQLARQAAMGLLDALTSMHAAGVCHGDVAADRIVLAQNGRFVLLHPQSLPALLSPENDLKQLGDLLVSMLGGSEGRLTAAQVPEDLRALVDEILSGSATAGTLLTQLRASNVAESVPQSEAAFVGRQTELSHLNSLYATLGNGEGQVVAVSGSSGIGKSALIRHFLANLPEEAISFTGVCNPGDTESFNAFDELAYDLESFLRQQPLVEQLLPRNALVLERLFPVFKTVLPADRGKDRWLQTDLDRIRRVAFGAFAELLGRISERWPLVIWLDDFHWADEESWALLRALLESLSPPDMLLILSFREEQGTEPKLASVHLETSAMESLKLAGLPPEDMASLARALSGTDRLETDIAALIAHAEGSPFLLQTLIRAAGDHEGAISPQLDTASRLVGLSAVQRTLIDLVAVAEAPLEFSRLSSLTGEDVSLAVSRLTELGLLQLVVVNGQQAAQVAHGRIREAALSEMGSVVRRECHAKLAALLEQESSSDYVALYRHHQGAGHYVEAYDSLINGARAASQDQLAFATAVSLYEEALRTSDRRSASVYPELAETLVLAGQPVSAAERFLVAAAMTSDLRLTIEHTASAAFQFLIGGHFDEGIRLFEEVLKHHRVTYPKRQRSTQTWIRRCIKMLAVRGLAFDERNEEDVPQHVLDKLDALDAIARNLLVIDSVRGVLFALLSLLHALRIGEPRRLFRALNFACSTPTVDASGKSNADMARRLLNGERLDAERRGDNEFVGRAAIDEAQVALYSGRWADTVKSAGEGIELLGGRNQYGWDCNMASMLAMRALEEMGDLNELLVRAENMVRAAEERGDFYGLVTGKLNQALIRLAHDRMDDAWDLVSEVEAMWAGFEFHLQHFYIYRIQVFCDLYTNDLEAARTRRQAFGPKFQASGLRSVQTIKNDYALLNGRLAVGLAAAFAEPVEFGADIEVLEKSDRIDLTAHAAVLRAGEAALANDPSRVQSHLENAADLFEQADMRLSAACARVYLGQEQASNGKGMLAAANAKLSAQGIKRPDRWLQLQVPGFRLARK